MDTTQFIHSSRYLSIYLFECLSDCLSVGRDTRDSLDGGGVAEQEKDIINPSRNRLAGRTE